MRTSPRILVAAAALQSKRVSIKAFVQSSIWFFLRALKMNAACNHRGAPMLRRKATTSLLFLSMAVLRAVFPSLQASGWLWFNEDREQHWQRLHLFFADKSQFEDTSSLQISRWPPRAEQINAVLTLGENGEDIELAKVRNEKEKQFGEILQNKSLGGAGSAYFWLHAFTSDLAEISSLQTSRWPLSAERINAVLPLGEIIELAKERNEKQKQNRWNTSKQKLGGCARTIGRLNSHRIWRKSADRKSQHGPQGQSK